MAPEQWISIRTGWELKTHYGDFWIGDASGSRTGKFEVEYTTPDGQRRETLGRTRSKEAAQRLAENKLRRLK